MSVARHHADWLSLVEVSGPFVSLPVLMRVFPQGLEPRDPAQAKAVRAAYEEWQDNSHAPGRHRAWIVHVLTELLGYPENQMAEGQTLSAGLETIMAEMGETLRPDLAVVGPVGTNTVGQPQLLVMTYLPSQALDRPVDGKHWKATPATRMMELLHGANVPLGLVTNGEHWMLVYAPRNETTGYASWYARFWMDEPITLRAFHSLLGARRLLGVAADSTLASMLAESAKDQQEVTNQLGRQVRQAVEVLVQALDELDQESNRTLLKGLAETSLYDAALTVMMRLVFMFSAEERGLLHLGTPLYDENYAVSTLQEQLQEVADLHGEEVLERRVDAWARLIATFRALHGGIQHQDLMMQAYGGSLFDPDRYPFLEGRAPGSAWRTTAAQPLRVNNCVALHLLNSLQKLRVRMPGGGPAETRRISFRALGVEQIGHVYEGLLDHTAVRASEPVLGLTGAKDKEPEIHLYKLESLLAEGQDKLIEFLKEKTGRSASALQRALDESGLLDEHKLLIACGHDTRLAARARPFAGFIRQDSFERPRVALAGCLHVTEGTARRSTGTHYTPPSLTEPIVRHTLEPLVYEGPAEGLERKQWKLKSPKSILDLKVCDMAMGSGAFLVQACRFLAERLVESWENEEKRYPGQVLITSDGEFSKGSASERLLPVDPGERLAIACRVVADRCLYGVDINPMAVEMAKLSLWLTSMDSARPFTFLDHAFKCGDSLLGIVVLEQLENFSLQRDGSKQQAFATLNLWRHIETAKDKREALELMSSDTPEQVAVKTALNAEAEDAILKLNAAADVLISVELKGLKGRSYEIEREIAADEMMAYWVRSAAELQAHALDRLEGRRCFHWPLAFPEVFNRGGFNAFVGNPPFMGGAKLETIFGTDYRALTVAFIANGVTGTRGTADLATYFLLRAQDLTRATGLAGLIVTNSLGQGDAREVGLSQVLNRGNSIIRSVPSSSWPGQATVFYAMVWIYMGTWRGDYFVDGDIVPFIDASMNAAASSNLTPAKLTTNEDIAFEGAKLSGEGFVVSGQWAKSILERDRRYERVLKPYLTGALLNGSYTLEPQDYVITFYDWPLSRETAPDGYHGLVAADFPECLEWVERNVKIQRDQLRPTTPWNRKLQEFWWHFGQWRWALDDALGKVGKALVLSRVTPHVALDWVEKTWVFSDRLTVFATDNTAIFVLLQSSFHDIWSWRYGTTNLSLLSYSPAACFLTFPFPHDRTDLEAIGLKYHQNRWQTMQTHGEGLTKIYNRLHDPNEMSADIAQLRLLHEEMDRIVAAAYGWSDLDLGHGFHETKQGVRYTLSRPARIAVLDRLMTLNRERHAAEVVANGEMGVSAPVKRGRKKRGVVDNLTLDLL